MNGEREVERDGEREVARALADHLAFLDERLAYIHAAYLEVMKLRAEVVAMGGDLRRQEADVAGRRAIMIALACSPRPLSFNGIADEVRAHRVRVRQWLDELEAEGAVTAVPSARRGRRRHDVEWVVASVGCGSRCGSGERDGEEEE